MRASMGANAAGDPDMPQMQIALLGRSQETSKAREEVTVPCK